MKADQDSRDAILHRMRSDPGNILNYVALGDHLQRAGLLDESAQAYTDGLNLIKQPDTEGMSTRLHTRLASVQEKISRTKRPSNYRPGSAYVDSREPTLCRTCGAVIYYGQKTCDTCNALVPTDTLIEAISFAIRDKQTRLSLVEPILMLTIIIVVVSFVETLPIAIRACVIIAAIIVLTVQVLRPIT